MAQETGAERRGRWHGVARLWQGQGLSLSAFLLSLVIAVINAYYAMRGPEIVVRPIEQVLLYRDDEGGGAVLTLAADITMINSASGEHGDVLVDAKLSPGAGRSFGYQSIIQPVFTNDKVPCELGVRCVKLPGLIIIERADDLLDIPGGGARARYLAFPATGWNCDGGAACTGLGDFSAAVQSIEKGSRTFKLHLGFHGDGERRLTCRTRPIDAAYLREVGWANVPCEESSVRSSNIL